MAISKAAAQAAAEAAAHDIAALSTDLIRSEARCREMQFAHVEVRYQSEKRCCESKSSYLTSCPITCRTAIWATVFHLQLLSGPQEMAIVTSELRRAHDETHTLADDIISMAEKSARDEEHIGVLQAALRDAQVP